jgi:penicillin-insensitive murein endopeptidase
MRYLTTLAALASLVTIPAALAAQSPARVVPSKQDAGGAVEIAAKAKKKKAHSKTKATKPPPAPAKALFGAAKTPAPMAARSIGFYAKGCLAGAAALPIDGPAWQAMRLSRNRNWAHPEMVALIEKLALEAKAHDGWPGLLVGDLSQPRGGPMLTGHTSHQVGLDADIWLTPMPDRRLTEKEREELSATSMLAEDRVSVNPQVWTEAHVRLLKRVASYPRVERVLVHPAIKKAMCQSPAAKEKDHAWLNKIRPIWGHHYHFHIRIACPKGSSGCEAQPPVGNDDGCGAELDRWLARVKNPPKPGPPGPEKAPITLAQLPDACRSVLASGDTPAAHAAEKAPAAKQAPPGGKKAAATK